MKTYKHKCGCVPAWVLLLMLLNVGHGHAQVKVTTVAGGFINDGKPATSSALQSPEGGRMDGAGNLYIADQFDHRLRKVSTTGVITTIAGTGIAGYSGDGGPAISAKISFPIDVAIDSAGNILFSDSGNNRIRKISTTGIITTIAGNGSGDGPLGDGGPAGSDTRPQPHGDGARCELLRLEATSRAGGHCATAERFFVHRGAFTSRGRKAVSARARQRGRCHHARATTRL